MTLHFENTYGSPDSHARVIPIQKSGFPFESRRDSDRSERFQSELENIAQRYPEFADQIERVRSNSNSNLSHTPNPESPRSTTSNPRQRYQEDWEGDVFPRIRRTRPIDTHLEEFGFPFTRAFDERDFYPEEYYHEQPVHQQPKEEAEVVTKEKDSNPAPQPSSESPAQKTPIQQSNTIDLGQAQEPVDDSRNQRSMSAPPENRQGADKRFVSSINIPNLNTGGGGTGDMGGRMSQEDASQQQKPHERIIPIHIEGRDDPVMPRTIPINVQHQQHRPQQEPEKIFGQRPSTFTQFVNKNNNSKQDQFARQQQDYQQQQAENYKKQKEAEENGKHQAQPQQQPQPQQQQPRLPRTSLDIIQNVQKDVSELMTEVEKFDGQPKDKKYLYLDEMLTRNLIKLDDIDTEGKDVIRTARKEAIKCIQDCIRILETKANANCSALAAAKSEENKMEVEAKSDSNAEENSEVNAESANNTASAPAEENKMETDNESREKAEVAAEASTKAPMDIEERRKSEEKREDDKKEADAPTETPSEASQENNISNKSENKKKKEKK
jgi:BCL2-associated athanogene 3